MFKRINSIILVFILFFLVVGCHKKTECEKNGHSYDKVVTNPTCLEKGYTTYTCHCGETYVSDYKEPHGHNYNEWTSNNDGTHTHVCKNDSTHKETKNCTFGEWITVTIAGPFSEGLEKHICSLCKYEETRIISATHTHEYSSEWTIDVEPTCEKEGSKSKHCTKDNCSSVTEVTKIEALGHSYGEVVYEWNASHTTLTATHYCLNDSTHKETETVTAVYKVVKEATCVDSGLGKYTSNSFRNTAFSVQTYEEKIESLGHNKVYHEGKAATCTNIGWNPYETCTRCDYTTYKEIDKFGHNYNEWTSNNDGTHTHVCKNDSTHKETKNCTFGEWITVTIAGPFSEGLEKHICSLCKYEETRIISATHTHEYSSEWTIDVEPTCEKEGSKSKHCTKDNCNSKTNITVIPIKPYSDGLIYELNSEKNGYIVVGIGECDDLDIKITPIYMGLPIIAIKEKAFHYCSGLTSITIPNSVTSIGSRAFSDCSSLTSITIPNSVTSIGSRAFSDCSSLTSITIPNSVTSIGSSAFSGCSSLTTIAIPNSVTSIGSSAFSGCSSLTSITIPNSVTSIGSSAFSRCSNLTSIAIPNSVTSIGDDAFSGCSSLTSIAIPNSVTSIGYSAFSGCSSLTSITLPFVGNRLNEPTRTHFGYIFGAESSSYNDDKVPSSLKEVIITGGTSIGHGAFYNCSNLTSITLPFVGNRLNEPTNTYFGYIFGASSYYNNDDEVPSSLKEVIITGGTSIGFAAFYNCSSLTSITIPNSVTSIGNSAFSRCNSLTSITIPNSVTSIGYSAFSGCSSLTSITLPFVGNTLNGTTHFGYIFGAESSSYNDDKVPSSLKEVIITGGTSIGSRAFYNCSNLTSITLPETIEFIDRNALPNDVNIIGLNNGYIGKVLYKYEDVNASGKVEVIDGTTQVYCGAFSNCSYITEISLPKSLNSIMEGAFYGCSSLNKITLTGISLNGTLGSLFGTVEFTGGMKTYQNGNNYYIPSSLKNINIVGKGSIPSYYFSNCKNIVNVEIEEITKVGSNAFYNCTNLIDFDFSKVSDEISSYAFSNCTGIRNIYLSDTITNVGYSAFNGMSGVTSLIIGSKINEIKDNVFSGLINLQSITFKGDIEKIGSNAFKNCRNITSIVIPDSVTSIGESAFSGCTGLITIKLGENVKSIGNNAFYNCTGLSSITFGSMLNTIGSYAFYNCSSLTGLNMPQYVTNIGSHAFYGCTGIATIKFSEGLLSIGESAFENCSKLTVCQIPDLVDSLGNRAFYNCSNLNTVIIGNGLTSIGQYAFYGCSKLVSLSISDSVKIVGNYAFTNCTSLSGIRIGNSVTALGDYAFSNCKGLTDVVFGESISEIGNYTFKDCISLANIVMNGNVTSVGTGAFYNCKQLTGIELKDVITLGDSAFENCSALNYIILDKLTNLGPSTFKACTSLNTIEIPNSVLVIGESAFYNCTSLENIILPNGLQNIGELAFYGCSSIKSIEIPNTVITIGNRVLENSGVEHVYLGSEIMMIGTKMFYNCTSLKSVSGADNITLIADSAFYNCNSLEAFNFPESLVSISDNAFYNCSSLKEIVLNEGLSSIGSNAFVNCSSAKLISIPQSIVYTTSGMLKGCGSVETLTIPFVGSSNVAVNANASTLVGFIFGTTSYTNSVKVTQNYSSTGSVTYYLPTNLKRIDVTSSTDILYGAFSNITSLKEIQIASSVTNIGENIISGSSNLELIYYRSTETNWNSLTKHTNWDANSSNYTLKFVPENIIRVYDAIPIENEELIVELYDETGSNLLHTGINRYYGIGIENVPAGNYILKAKKGAFSKSISIEVKDDMEITLEENIDILEQFKDRELIAVLTWGEHPYDLDSHMTYNDTISKYHIYYQNKIDSTTGTNLDIDDVNSYGPEVITVLKLQDGIYRYSVYDYSHGSSTTSSALSNSGAVVKLYVDGELVKTYEVPTGIGCLWTVFEYNGSTGSLTEINTITGGMSSSEVN